MSKGITCFVFERNEKFLYFDIETGKWFKVTERDKATKYDTYDEAFRDKLNVIMAGIRHSKITKVYIRNA